MRRTTRLLGALAGALFLHAPLVLIGGSTSPASRSGHAREAPVQLRVIDAAPRAPAVAAAMAAPDRMQGPPRPDADREPRAAAAPASSADGQGGNGPGFDVAPVPERGWQVNLRSFNPWAGAGRATVVIEVEVSAQGEIRRWRLLRSTVPDDMAMAMLSGLGATAMLPAIRAGEPVDAIARYELNFGPP